MKAATIIFIAIASLISASGQLLLKRGSLATGNILRFSGDRVSAPVIIKKLIAILFEPHIFIAIILYFSSLFLWLKVLSRTEVSYAYPILISLTIMLTTTLSIIFFKETLTGAKIVGTVLVIAGLFLMTQVGR